MGKSIAAPVGVGGANFYPDVMTVQYLLNCVLPADGGPVLELVIDGVAGPLTCQAIRGFQQAQFGWADGRVDPEAAGGVTIRQLNLFDCHPDSQPFTFSSVPAPARPTLFVKKHSGLRVKKHSGLRFKKHSGV
jgi:peptidoglycan hydrolase-like protein with peptidoglycan-binding domain